MMSPDNLARLLLLLLVCFRRIEKRPPSILGAGVTYLPPHLYLIEYPTHPVQYELHNAR